MSSIAITVIRCSLTLLVLAPFVSGCSSSSNSNSESTQSPAAMSTAMGSGGASETGTSSGTNVMEDGVTNDTAGSTQADNVSAPIMPDPLSQSSTRVEFSITVPAYQSNALQVQLMWHTNVFNASWVGDELWEASAEFPTSTEHELVVTFSDANGGITLGQYNTVYKTGTNDAENVHVTADQFNVAQWDDDRDGTSNIDELLVGTDPLVDEASLLEIRDSAGVSLSFITDSFESRIPNERPYNEYYEEQLVRHEGGRPPSGAAHTIDISIDESGNGTLSDSRLEGVGISPLRTSYTGTRTHAENSIQWDGKRQTSQDFLDLYITTSSVNTVSLIDDRTRKYEETYRYNYDTSDESTYTIQTQIELIGEVVDGTPFCQPIAGTVVSDTTSPRDDNGISYQISISKEIDDQYWRVKSIETGPDSSETEYLAREFNSTFQCKFVEF